MGNKIKLWVWKNTIIDFEKLTNKSIEKNDHIKKVDYIFHHLGVPDKKIHEWYNGGWSCEYNEALNYGIQLGLIEWYKDYEAEYYNLQGKIDKAVEYIIEEYFKRAQLGITDKTFQEGEIQRLLKILQGEE